MNMFTKTVASLAFASGLFISNTAMAVDGGDLSFLTAIASAGIQTPQVQVAVQGQTTPIILPPTTNPADVAAFIASVGSAQH